MMARWLSLLVAAFLLCPTGARAQERPSPFSKIKEAVARKAFTLESTSALSLSVGAAFGQEYTRDLQFGLSYRYFFNDYLGIGVTVLGGLPFEGGLTDEIRSARPEAINNVRPETMRLAGTVDLHLVPIYGKFVLFGRFSVHYDLSLCVGFGVALVQGKGLDGQINIPTLPQRGTFTPSFGAGFRLLFSQHVGMTVDFRDYLWDEQNPITRQKSWSNHYSVTLGPTFRF
jgi:outer membrane beta-barrel protein